MSAYAGVLGSLLGPACTIDVEFASGPSARPPAKTKAGDGGKAVVLPLFTAHDSVSGQVHLTPAAGKKVEHQGVRLELVGTIELLTDRGNTYDFVSMGAPAGQGRRKRLRLALALPPCSRSPARSARPGAARRVRVHAVVLVRVQQRGAAVRELLGRQRQPQARPPRSRACPARPRGDAPAPRRYFIRVTVQARRDSRAGCKQHCFWRP